MRTTLTAFAWLLSVTAVLADDMPTIPLHVTIISERPEFTAAFTEENIAWIAQNLNKEFKSGDGQQQARFAIRARTDLEAETRPLIAMRGYCSTGRPSRSATAVSCCMKQGTFSA